MEKVTVKVMDTGTGIAITQTRKVRSITRKSISNAVKRVFFVLSQSIRNPSGAYTVFINLEHWHAAYNE